MTGCCVLCMAGDRGSDASRTVVGHQRHLKLTEMVNRRRHTARKPMGYRAPDISLINDCWTYVMAC
jgi:hypothetical protein